MITDITISFKKFTQLLRNGKLIKGKRLQCLQYYTVALTIVKIICYEFGCISHELQLENWLS